MQSFLSGLKPRLRRLRFGFLLGPGLFVAAAIGLAFGAVALDRAAGRAGLGFGVARDPEAARTVLTVIAGSLITVAGVTFSIVMVTLQLVSQQFTPRALRTFLGDRLTQSVAGSFIGVFVFCVLVLRTVQGSDGGGSPFVPTFSVTVAIVLAVIALGLLLVFFDHMARGIQVSTIAADVAQATLGSVRRMYPEPFGEPAGDDAEAVLRECEQRGDPEVVGCDRPGYIQSVTIDDIPNEVGSPGLRIDVRVKPGDFVTQNDELAVFWPGEADRDVGQALRLAVVIADERDLQQDPGYGLRQLADIATKALSPGVNDPTTAWTCIRYLQAVMERLADRREPDRVRAYEESGTTVVTRHVEFGEYVEAAYAQVGRYADDPRIAGALLDGIERVAAVAAEAGAGDRVESLRQAAERVAATALAAEPGETDRRRIESDLGRIDAHR